MLNLLHLIDLTPADVASPYIRDAYLQEVSITLPIYTLPIYVMTTLPIYAVLCLQE